MTVSVLDLAYTSAALALISLIAALLAWRAVGRLRRRLSRLLQGSQGSLEQALADAQSAAVSAGQGLRELEKRVNAIEDELPYALSRVGIVRFNPFADTGSDLSFAVALLDRRDCGLVLTGLWGREEVRVYAKQIQDGKSSYPLSDEEQQALELARRRRPRRED
jgi:hypothetical protein